MAFPTKRTLHHRCQYQGSAAYPHSGRHRTFQPFHDLSLGGWSNFRFFAVFQCFFSRKMYLERQINMTIKHPLFVDVFRNPAQQVLRKWPDPLYPASRKWKTQLVVSTRLKKTMSPKWTSSPNRRKNTHLTNISKPYFFFKSNLEIFHYFQHTTNQTS